MKSHSGALAVILLCVGAAFFPVLSNGFTNWDDDLLVTGNAYLQSPTWHNFAYLWLHPHIGLYFPLTYSSYYVDQLVGGGKPWVFHVSNLLLHLVAVACVFRILLLLCAGEPDSPKLLGCAAGALLFGLHPIQTEAVSWISARKDVLGGSLALAAVLLYLTASDRSRIRKNSGAPELLRVLLLHAAALFVYLLSLLAKPGAVGLPLALAALDCLVLRRPFRKVMLSLLPWICVAAIMTAVTSSVQFVDPDVRALTWTRRIVIAFDALGFYAGRILYPHGFATIYGRTAQSIIPGPAMLGGIFAALVPIFFVLLGNWRLAGAAAFFLAMFLPILGFRPFAYQNISTVSDRYAYLPMAGAAMGLCFGINYVLRARPDLKRVLMVASSVLLLGLGLLANAQARVWRDSETLWTHNIAVAPLAAEAQCNLSAIHFAQGKRELAFAEINEAVRLKPTFAEAQANLGLFLFGDAQTTRGLESLKRASELDPRSAGIHFSYGSSLLQAGDAVGAIRELRNALEINPRMPSARQNLAIAYEKTGNRPQAIAELEATLKEFPDYKPARDTLKSLSQ